MEAIDEVIGRIMKRALAGSGRETANVVLADGMCSRSKKPPTLLTAPGSWIGKKRPETARITPRATATAPARRPPRQ